MKKILPIVEGDGDMRAVPVLIRKILHANNLFGVDLHPAQKRNDYSKLHNTFDNYFSAAIKWEAPILWVLDFDCKQCACVKTESQKLYSRADALRPGWPFKVAFIVKEFEALFLAEQQSTKAVLGIPEDFNFSPNPETIKGAKGEISRALPVGKAYKETVHQEKIAAQLDLNILRNVSSDFRHLERSVLYLARL